MALVSDVINCTTPLSSMLTSDPRLLTFCICCKISVKRVFIVSVSSHMNHIHIDSSRLCPILKYLSNDGTSNVYELSPSFISNHLCKPLI